MFRSFLVAISVGSVSTFALGAPPDMPATPTSDPAFTDIAGVNCKYDPTGYHNGSNNNFPWPPHPQKIEHVFDGLTNVADFKWGASYNLGPAGVLEMKIPIANHTYSLYTGTHSVKSTKVGIDPAYVEDPEDWFWDVFFSTRVTFQQQKIWHTDWRVRVIVADEDGWNHMHFIAFNDPSTQDLMSVGITQKWIPQLH
jgi:hypothetical protein